MDAVEISVIMPVFNERDSLESLIGEICTALGHLRWEIVGVDDASTDDSADVLRRARRNDPRIRVVVLAGRAGQSGAILAGIEAAHGDIVAMLDADGQNDPADLPEMLSFLIDGRADAVVGYRAHRADGVWKRFQSRVANAVRNRVTGDSIRDIGCSLRVARRRDLLRVPRFDGMHRFLPTLLRLAGRRVLEVPVRHRPRAHGRSKYGMWDRLWVGLGDALGVRWLRLRRLSVTATEEDDEV